MCVIFDVGVGFVLEDCMEDGLVVGFLVVENLIFDCLDDFVFSCVGMLWCVVLDEFVCVCIVEYDICI